MAVNSPCIDVCRIDGKSGPCVGCFRTPRWTRVLRCFESPGERHY
ncbi:DUF1289 domain-containing protein [Paraburkholderia kirstenboschensis]